MLSWHLGSTVSCTIVIADYIVAILVSKAASFCPCS